MRYPITFLLLCCIHVAFAQIFKERELKTEISEVTVFLSGAQIFETGTTTVPTGKTIFSIKNLSPFIDEKSIQVKAQGDFTILSVNHKFNYLNELKKDKKIDSLTKLVDDIEARISRENARLEVLHEKQSLLNENKNLGGTTSGVTIVQLKQAIDLYDAEITKIKEEELKGKNTIDLAKKEQDKLKSEIKQVSTKNSLPTSEIEISVRADAQVATKFSVTYLVSNAGWYPKYDIRVENVKSPLELTYKAEVFQNTGLDWKNVKLRFSNGDPNQSGVVPELKTWNLNYARNTNFERNGVIIPAVVRNVKGRVVDETGTGLPGANVLVAGTTIGNITDRDGNYNVTLPNGATQLQFSSIGYTTKTLSITSSEINVAMTLDVTQLNEVVVRGYDISRALQGRSPGVRITGAEREPAMASIVETTVVENQTTVEIEVETPYTIKSNGEKLLVDLKKHQIDAVYEYYAIPKLDKDAFLIARIINWDQYNLLEGEANLYFEDAYVGRSILDAKALQDTLNISLGRDKNIVLGRQKNEQFTKKKSIGTNTVESRGFKIIVRNKKSQPIKLTVFDQIPLTVISDITVSPLDLTGGKLDEKTGKITWEFNLEGQQQKDLNLQYEVKYPKREKVMLE